jgi:hypothetical protein
MPRFVLREHFRKPDLDDKYEAAPLPTFRP